MCNATTEQRMHSKILFLLFFLLAAPSLMAQTMRDILRQMPDTLVPLLTRNNLLDFPDYIDSQMKAELSNRLTGTSEMLQLTDDYTVIQTSPASTIQLKLLPKGKAKIICLVRTYFANDSIGDSQFSFYTSEWKPMKASKMFTLSREHNEFLQLRLFAADTHLEVVRRRPLDLRFEGDTSAPPAAVVNRFRWAGSKFVSMKP